MASDMEKIKEVLRTMNKYWCHGPGKDTWESQSAEIVHGHIGMSAVFVETSCVITSAAAGHVLGMDYNWELLSPDAPVPTPPYRVTWGNGDDGWIDTEHSATIVCDSDGKSWLLQSYFNTYTPQFIQLTPKLSVAMEKSDMETVTGVQESNQHEDMHMFYWIPKAHASAHASAPASAPASVVC